MSEASLQIQRKNLNLKHNCNRILKFKPRSTYVMRINRFFPSEEIFSCFKGKFVIPTLFIQKHARAESEVSLVLFQTKPNEFLSLQPRKFLPSLQSQHFNFCST